MKIKNVLSWFGLLALFGGIFFLGFFQSEKMRKVADEGLRTVGLIESIGSNVICRYKIDGANYEYKKSQPFTGLQDGETYEVAYIPNEEENAVILYENFIFPDTIIFFETKSIRAKEQFVNSDNFQFSYSVDEKTYTRYQKYKEGEKIDENKTYNVKYNPKNPRIAYLIYEES